MTSVLITGGGSGIGAALARQLAARGCDVVVSGRRADVLDEVVRSSERITGVVGDVTDAEHRGALVSALASLPAPRAVVHAAGHFQVGQLDALSRPDWRRSFEVNVEARWELSRECAGLLDVGRILFLGSDAGANPRNGAAAYSIAQAASETLRRALQMEWADRSIAVGAFKPGLVDTDMVREFMALTTDEFPGRTAYDEYVSSGQITSPAMVARFATWLLLDVDTPRFVDTEWDIRDAVHHDEWASVE